jgi:hypothetical protein
VADVTGQREVSGLGSLLATLCSASGNESRVVSAMSGCADLNQEHGSSAVRRAVLAEVKGDAHLKGAY